MSDDPIEEIKQLLRQATNAANEANKSAQRAEAAAKKVQVSGADAAESAASRVAEAGRNAVHQVSSHLDEMKFIRDGVEPFIRLAKARRRRANAVAGVAEEFAHRGANMFAVVLLIGLIGGSAGVWFLKPAETRTVPGAPVNAPYGVCQSDWTEVKEAANGRFILCVKEARRT